MMFIQFRNRESEIKGLAALTKQLYKKFGKA
jgi:hypothetical protein